MIEKPLPEDIRNDILRAMVSLLGAGYTFDYEQAAQDFIDLAQAAYNRGLRSHK